MRPRQRRRGCRFLAVLLAWTVVRSFAATAPPDDPLHSPSWPAMAALHLGGGAIVFDDRVQVLMPAAAENALAVPVEISVNGLADVREVRVIADLNPIPYILAFQPVRADVRLGFEFKVEQSTPVRAAARTADGAWHVGGAWLRASGGGCTAASQGTGSGLWRDRLNEVSGAQFPRGGGDARLKVRVIHPMDTGLAGGIPAFYIETLDVLDELGGPLASLQTFEPVSENPVFSFDLHHRGAVRIVGRDTQGNRIDAQVAP